MIITRTVTEELSISTEALADELGLAAEFLATRTPEQVAEYVTDHAASGDVRLFDPANIADEIITVREV